MHINTYSVRSLFPSVVLFMLPLLAVPAGAQERNWSYGPHMMWDGGWWMFLGPLWMILLLALVVAGAMLGLRWLARRDDVLGPRSPSRPTPLEILQERFARGEIDRQEYEERKKILE